MARLKICMHPKGMEADFFCYWTKGGQTTDSTYFSTQGIGEILPGQCMASR